MICPRCSYENTEGAKNCYKCGLRLVNVRAEKKAADGDNHAAQSDPAEDSTIFTKSPHAVSGSAAAPSKNESNDRKAVVTDQAEGNTPQIRPKKQIRAGTILVVAAVFQTLALILPFLEGRGSADFMDSLRTIVDLFGIDSASEVLGIAGFILDGVKWIGSAVNVIQSVPVLLIVSGVWIVALSGWETSEYSIGMSVIHIVYLVRTILTVILCVVSFTMLMKAVEGTDMWWAVLVPVLIGFFSVFYCSLIVKTIRAGLPSSSGGTGENASLTLTIVTLVKGLLTVMFVPTTEGLWGGAAAVLFGVVLIHFRKEYQDGINDSLNGIPEPRGTSAGYNSAFEVGRKQYEYNKRFR